MNHSQAAAGALPATKDDLRESESRANARITELRADMERRHAETRADLRMFFGTIIGLFGVLVSAAAAIFVAVAF